MATILTYHFNAVGSTIAMTDASQTVVNKYAYDPFGNILSQNETVQPNQPFKYVGQFGVMTEPNGFYYMRARYYDPQVGRFISEDPIGSDGGDVNLYAYVGGNPVGRIDPSGKAPFWDHFRDGYNLDRNAGGGIWAGIKRGWNEMMVDIGKYGDIAAVHATAEYPGQSPKAAMAATQAMIDTGRLNGVKLPEEDMQAIIDHASLDLRTPAHMGSYYGGIIQDPVGTLNHLGTEIIDSISGRNGVTQRSSGVTSGCGK